MLQILFCLTVIITAVYSDCCPNESLTKCAGDKTDDVDCHLENYGIYCCNENVKDSIALFANDSLRIVRLNCLLLLLYVHYFVLQLQKIQHLEDHGSAGHLNISNKTIDFLLHNFTSICKRYTKVMATKHQLQHCMFKNSDETLNTNLTDAVIHLETAAFRLQHIQVSNLVLIIYIRTLFKLQKLHTNRPCLEFTATQYQSIYYSKYNINSIEASLEEWANTTENCCGRWNKYN